MWFPQEALLRTPVTQSPLVSQPEVVGTYLPGTGILGWGASCGSGNPHSEITLPNFYPCGCGASPFRVLGPPTSLRGCSFFNSVVVRLPFNSIADDSEL